MSLAEVKHQGRAQETLQRAFARDRVPHAYLFHGPRGVGKETLARGLAQLLLCNDPTDHVLAGEGAGHIGVESLRTGCGECEDCRLVLADTHPDLHLVYRQLNRRHPDSDVRNRKGLVLAIDVIRHFLIARVAHKPARGRAKVFILRDADRMKEPAQNALLKTLEEPPPTTFVILLTSAVDQLLPTTLSRCQIVALDALPTAFVREKLAVMQSDLDGKQLDWYSRSADGSIGRAIEAVEEGLFDLNKLITDGLARLGNLPADTIVKSWTQASEALGQVYRRRDPEITETEAKRTGLKTIFRLAAGWYADVLHLSTRDGAPLLKAPALESLKACAASMDAESVALRINRIARAEHQLDLNVNKDLCVETLVHELTDGVAAT